MTDAQHNQGAATIAVLGAGTWGLTLADLLARNGHGVRCWDINAALIADLAASRTHPKLADFTAHEGVVFAADLAEALDGAEAGVVVVPSHAMRPFCESVAATGRAGGIDTWIICTKGVEQGSLMLMNEVMIDVLGGEASQRVGILSGPSHAEEVSRGLPTTVSACAPDAERARRIQEWFFRPYFRVYTHDDMPGVELGAAIKNVIAIASGVAEGMGFGDNCRAALITRGLAEIVRLGLALGARLETFMGLSGVGDLIVTATSHHSRNFQFGRFLAQGMDCEQALKEVGMVVEGYHTALSAWQLAERHGVEMPITQAVHSVLYEGKSAVEAVQELLSRDPKPEIY